MATIAENIHAMAALVAEVKRSSRLSEGTILRIVDMNFALAQQGNQGFESQMPNDALPPFDESEFEVTEVPAEEGQLIAFPTVEGDEEVLAAVTPEEES